MEVKSIINSETIHIESDNIYSVIFIKINDMDFPDKHWVDFGVVILTWWLEEILNFIKGYSDEMNFQFMDGPFLLKITKNQLKWVVSMHEKDKVKNVYVTRKIIESFLRSVVTNSKIMINKLDKMRIHDDDISLLITRNNECEKLLTTRFS